jgi:hypothetical protein
MSEVELTGIVTAGTIHLWVTWRIHVMRGQRWLQPTVCRKQTCLFPSFFLQLYDPRR